ncbi:MAG: glycerophosphoryl diester phosphodiesterase membrane domain-containing protein, partial [Lachnospiraceae bacterium]|nr:glycerophosphoryl diester phosphodiesterase membrane domain-containing protein [Lachnospiraceae bacterium]
MKKYYTAISSTINNSLWLIGFNIIPIILFVLFFMVFNIFGAITIIEVMTDIALFVSGTKYIGPDNLMSLLLFPPSWIIILLSFIFFSFFAIFEISGLIYACSQSMYNKKTSFTNIILKSIKSSERSLTPRNWMIIVFVIIIFPLASFISLSSATFCLKVPEFISDFLLANKVYGVLYILLHIIIFILEIRYVFAFYYYTIEEDNFIEACKKSKSITNMHYLEIITSVIIMSIIFFIISTSISAIISETIYTFTSRDVLFTRSAFTQDFQILFKNFLYAVISPLFNVACLTVLFFRYHNQKELDISQNTITTDNTKVKLGKIIWLIIFCIIFGAFQIILHAHTLFPKNDTLNIPYIVAHRRDSVRAPENTMPAFELAVQEENEYIEFDVHQTKDNVIIISHDDNLLRVTGQNVCVHDLTYEEIQKLDTGKWFSKQ